MKLLIAATLISVILAGKPTAAPDCVPDQCGPKMVAKWAYTGPADATSFGCEICLDSVLIAETYAECDESKVKDILECDCDKKYGGGPADKACRASVDKIAHEVISDTNADPTAVCEKVLKKNCTYSIMESAAPYNPYKL